jgi:hypothetical protein
MSESTVETTQPSTPLSTLAPLINVFPPSLPQSPYDISVLIANIVSGISNTKITPSNVPLLIPIIMSKVELIKQLNGVQKQAIVLGVLDQLVNLLPGPEQLAVRLIIQQLGPSLITCLIDASKGVYNFGKTEVSKLKESGCCRCF